MFMSAFVLTFEFNLGSILNYHSYQTFLYKKKVKCNISVTFNKLKNTEHPPGSHKFVFLK